MKIHGGPYQRVGLSDIIGCCQGKFIAIEVKLPSKEGKLTKSQEQFMQEINDAGGFAFLSTSIDRSVKLMKGILGGEYDV